MEYSPRKFFAATFLVVVFSVSSIANAALVGRLAATPGGTDYQAYYDDVADLTWLADANAAGTTMNWTDANAWAAGLDIDGIAGWRLPDIVQPDATCGSQSGGVSYGYNCTGSEMGNLFYNVLGAVTELLTTPIYHINTTYNANYDLFSNVNSRGYWSATEFAPNTYDAWGFTTYDGFQGTDAKLAHSYAWAVHTGDVSAVPLPAAVWLFGSGLLGLIGLAKRRKQS